MPYTKSVPTLVHRHVTNQIRGHAPRYALNMGASAPQVTFSVRLVESVYDQKIVQVLILFYVNFCKLQFCGLKAYPSVVKMNRT